jgi:hypothetical protein
MNGEFHNVVAVEKAVTPTLQFGIKLRFYEESIAVITVGGNLLSPDNALLAPLFELNQGSRNQSTPLRSPTGAPFDGQFRTEEYAFLGAQLGQKEMDHIEDARARDPKNDVHLRIQLTVRTLIPTARTLQHQKAPGALSSGPSLVASGSDRVFSILHQPQGSGFLLQNLETTEIGCRISGTDWLKDYAPRLGLGNFTVLDIPDPSVLPELADERFARAVKHALKARDILRAGEWEDVCEELRHVWEMLRDLPLVQQVLVSDGYTSDAADLVDHALKDLFNLASKFVHSLDRDKRVLPEIKPKKEDAYLVFTTTMSAMNLIARKAKRLGQRL